MPDMTPAPISVERYTVTGDIAYPIHEDTNGEYVRHSDYAALLRQLTERDAEVERLRNGTKIEVLNLLTQLRAAERAREEAHAALAAIRDSTFRSAMQLRSIADRFLAASVGKVDA